ncbi:type II-A CRISPR-associated protein Csn2 [Atopobium sp. oral taxon 199]|uniref:type II-A CRISPR-associated protein Csn2 n=1 Tax=Atopobium sp. oral taxon 199 TaxID=712156 RepID=UPI00034E3231|nr:type II-A CRISPR-associated protein Csn2 [Atopobium sp. oral taxon 199]EPD77541.1 CRISPR type II-a/nmemi-associated protein csn2 [Atopobium sp. oral taxon 199 str. F0494]
MLKSKKEKTFDFDIDAQVNRLYLNKLMSFVSLALDASYDKMLTFVNLKTFLTKNELERFYEYIFFSRVRVLMLENKMDQSYHKHENKSIVDQHFLEF